MQQFSKLTASRIKKPNSIEIGRMKQSPVMKTIQSKNSTSKKQRKSKLRKSVRNYAINNQATFDRRPYNQKLGHQGTFDAKFSEAAIKNLKTDNISVQKVQKNLKKYTNNRGKHEKWSLKDVPIKLLRKPTNFHFLYNTEAMNQFYNQRMAQSDLRSLKNSIVNTSFDNIKDYEKNVDK